ncbi:unnamed protein product [Cylicocyclus nassatus]|uniref:Uncharacterized protein n=1 Tax=Cylicocyclus nassatus TaxID=53992 RepID=A0AA36HFU9_CYLNA|nr:unnamed protein product [Cylicocyclus nassatus]
MSYSSSRYSSSYSSRYSDRYGDSSTRYGDTSRYTSKSDYSTSLGDSTSATEKDVSSTDDYRTRRSKYSAYYTSAYTTNDDYKFKDKKNEEKEEDIVEKDYTSYLDTKRGKLMKSDDITEKSREAEEEKRIDYGTDELEKTTTVVEAHVTTAKDYEAEDEKVVEDAEGVVGEEEDYEVEEEVAENEGGEEEEGEAEEEEAVQVVTKSFDQLTASEDLQPVVRAGNDEDTESNDAYKVTVYEDKDHSVDLANRSEQEYVKEKQKEGLEEKDEGKAERSNRIPLEQTIPRKKVSELIAKFNRGNVENEAVNWRYKTDSGIRTVGKVQSSFFN